MGRLNVHRTFFFLLVGVLVVAGITLAAIRHVSLDMPLFPEQDSAVWVVEARIDFDAGEAATEEAADNPVTAQLTLPDGPPGFFLMAEQAASPGYGFAIVDDSSRRRGEWSTRTAEGQQRIYYKARFATVPVDRQALPALDEPPEVPDIFWEEPLRTAAAGILEQARTRASSPGSLARQLMDQLERSQQNANLLLSQYSRPQVLERLLNQAGVPARVSRGLALEDGRRFQGLDPLLEVRDGDRWLPFDPTTGEQGLPQNFLLWQRGGEALLEVVGGQDSAVRFSMIRDSAPALSVSGERYQDSPLHRFSLNSLPIEEQSVFQLLLLLPLGALVVTVLRVIAGVPTSGTFMPVLIALAFLQTELLPGLISLVAIVALGLVLRGYLSRLNLLLVPRIAVLIILVVFLIAGMSVLGYHLGFNTGMTVTFFPMVIIAWTIERLSILWEEDGPREVAIQGSGSLVVAVAAYLIMSWPLAAHLAFNFPELHLVILALVLLTGQYTGYKLSELRRFHAFREGD